MKKKTNYKVFLDLTTNPLPTRVVFDVPRRINPKANLLKLDQDSVPMKQFRILDYGNVVEIYIAISHRAKAAAIYAIKLNQEETDKLAGKKS